MSKQVFIKGIFAAGLTAFAQSAYAADDFDITMDVVGADESFGQAIVNRIELPFSASNSASVQELHATSSDADDLVDLLQESINEAQIADDSDYSERGAGMGVEVLPEITTIIE